MLTTAFAILGLFALRLGVPIAIMLVLGEALERLDPTSKSLKDVWMPCPGHSVAVGLRPLRDVDSNWLASRCCVDAAAIARLLHWAAS